MPATVRRARTSDRDLLLGSGGLFDTAPSADGLSAFLAAPAQTLAIAVTDDGCVGFAAATHMLRPDQAPQMYVDDLGVLPAHRRQGIGTRLLDLLASHAGSLGCSSIWLLSDPTPEALGFYASLGWVREGNHIAMFSKDLGA